MKLLFITLPLLVLACAGTVGKGTQKAASATPAPPQVTGAVHLVYAGTMGAMDDIRPPWGLSFGLDGTLYVCDRDKSSIVRLNGNGTVISRFDSFTNRTGRLYAPIDVCSSSGIEIYIIDATGSRVLRFDRNLQNGFTIFHGRTKEVRLFGSFNGLAYDKMSGDLYITDHDDGVVLRVDMLGGSIRSLGGFGSDRVSLKHPAGLDVDDNGVLYIADTGAGAVAVVKNFGEKITFIGGDALEAPVDVTVLPNWRIAVADSHGILILSNTGAYEAFAGYGIDRTMTPRSVAFLNGKLYVSDGVSSSILVYEVTK